MSLIDNTKAPQPLAISKPHGDLFLEIQNESEVSLDASRFKADAELESLNSKEENLDISLEANKIVLPDEHGNINEEEEAENKGKRKGGVVSYLLSFFYFHYFNCVMRWNKIKANKKNLTLQDIPNKESIDEYIEDFNKRVEDEAKRGIINTKKLLKITLIVFFWDIFACLLLSSVDIVCRILYSYFIGRLLKSLVNFHDDEKFFWTGILLMTMMVHCIIGHKGMLHMTSFSTKFRLTMVTVLYYKVLRMNNYHIQSANIGKIVNIIAQDMNIFEGKAFFLIWVLTIPVSLTISFVFLWLEFGPICLIALALFLVVALFQQFLSRFNVRFVQRRNIFSDKRMKFCNEVIEGIRIIKLYAWELAFKKIIQNLRQQELLAFQSIHRISFLDKSFSYNTGCLSALLLLIAYTYIYNETLTPNKIFFSLQLLDFVKLICMYYAGAGVNCIFELRVTFLRLIDILSLKEIPPLPENVLSEREECLSEFKNYTASWTSGEPSLYKKAEASSTESKKILKNIDLPNSPLKQKASADVLIDLNLKIKRNTIYAMFGKVGCGKSSFLLVFLQELPKFSGEFYNKARLAYVEQEPYIMPGTVRDNIVFGRKFNRSLYKKVIYLCSLHQDLERLPNMDLTEIGERGINISGGQKARISLARALYSDADLYLLDDPLSAVDSKVGRHLFDSVIKGYLKKHGKTVILVTHQVHFLREVDQILMMSEGKIVKQGCYSDFTAELEKYFNSDVGKKVKKSEIVKEEGVKETQKKDGKLFSNEEKEKITVDLALYIKYFYYSRSKLLCFFVFFLFLVWETIRLMIYRIFAMFGTNQLEQEKIFLTIGLLLVGVILFGVLKYFAIIALILKSNKNIHLDMFDGMIKSPVVFFDQTPSGAILNRFSNDLSQLDGNLIHSLIDCFELGLMQIGYFVSIAIINVWYLIVIALLIVIYYFIYISYKFPLGETKRLDLIYKGPLFTSFSSSITGLLSTRVYAQQKNFQVKYKKLVQNNFQTNTYFYGVSRSFGFQMEFIGVFFASVGLFTVISSEGSQNGLIGQTIMFLIQSTEFIQWTFRQYLSMNTMMSSAARCLNYADLKHEGELLLETDKQLQKIPEERKDIAGSKRWPFLGSIKYDEVFMKYREGTDYVLKGLTFDIKRGEKVGCVGRTGAGKSSIIQCMFKMVNIEKKPDGSCIFLDGVNINDVGLHTLRGGLSIIPQTPFVFSGSIRRNLDPFNEYTNDEIWDALEHVDLKNYVESLEHGLETDMTMAQNVFSIGQKQLICLARTLLKKNQVLVLDEATANVDLETDELIQRKIKENFKSCTVLTIAHRLYTVADYDKIIVMDNGRVAEFDTPLKLLTHSDKDPEITRNGIFADMVRNTGPETAKKILDIARNKYLSSL